MAGPPVAKKVETPERILMKLGPILMISTSCDVFPRKEMPLGDHDTSAHLGGHMPKKAPKIMHFEDAKSL